MNEAREGMQSGPWHDTRENRTPSDASRSSDGVCTDGSPAHPIMSARCWSDMTSTMLGDVVVTMAVSVPVAPRSPEGFLRSSHEPTSGGPNKRPDGGSP